MTSGDDVLEFKGGKLNPRFKSFSPILPSKTYTNKVNFNFIIIIYYLLLYILLY